MIQFNDPVRCPYCESASAWSSEQTESTLVGEEHVCPSCGQQTTPWSEETNQSLDSRQSMDWLEADPIF